MANVSELFGSLVFDERVMKTTLSADTYKSLRKTIEEGVPLDIELANSVAQAMKNWAINNGATHFTHWFQPLTGVTAEKHDSFISPLQDGGVIMEFSGKELIKGEPDASSFPSGGIRATFEARGYTAWDPTSYAFLKDKTLCIPTAFCSYSGEALDKKTPLLRSMDVLSKQAVRVLRCFGNESVKRVTAMVGPEQEYFLIPKKLYDLRPDLRFTGRTLFGAMSPKGQELDDHYFGSIRTEVGKYMSDINEKLWKLGICAKTEHNEVAPSQHELACIYTTVNVATDQNQVVMDVMKRTAEKHGLVCLLHEKPFDGVNGSGKHNNWSMATDTGVNLLSPGETPYENAQFLLFLCAVIEAVDKYQDLLRISVATASNDHRLGANEAPPAIISMFVGDELGAVLDAIEKGVTYKKAEDVLVKLGPSSLPRFSRDNTDRNRTSPFAFTGNKFEFRMPGSSVSIADANTIINSIVADVLCSYADKLEGVKDFDKALHKLIKDTVKKHKKIVFNGNGYDESWVKEAAERGLLNYRTTADCIPHLLDKKNVDMFTKHKIYSESELKSRYITNLEIYCKTIAIEAKTMIEMSTRSFIPAISKYTGALAESITAKKSVSKALACATEVSLLEELCSLLDTITEDAKKLESILSSREGEDYEKESVLIKEELLPAMDKLRTDCDKAEVLTAKEYWPIPSYEDLLFWTEL